MNDTLMTTLLSFFTAFSGAFIGWLFGRKRQKGELNRLHIDNIDAAIATWQKVVDALEAQVARLLEQKKSDADKIEELCKQVSVLQDTVDDLQCRLRLTEKLEEKIQRYEKLLGEHNIAY